MHTTHVTFSKVIKFERLVNVMSCYHDRVNKSSAKPIVFHNHCL